jgi:nanoRNase/pAp phosphatase (c-di-AMP/oligoRNAs hydrolase)
MSRGVSDLDLEMFYKLYKLSDRSLLNELDMNMIQFSDLYAYGHAINSIKIYDNLSFSNTGIDCPEALIATISDFVLALEEVNLSIVYSLKKDGIKLSVRSDREEYDAGLITKLALEGIGNGGGHDRMAGGFVLFGPDVNKEMLCAEIEERFIQVVQEKAYLTAD